MALDKHLVHAEPSVYASKVDNNITEVTKISYISSCDYKAHSYVAIYVYISWITQKIHMALLDFPL